MKLYGYWRSSCTWRVRIALGLKGIKHSYEPIHLLKDGGEQNADRYRALNPLRTVPLLEIEDRGKVVRIAQSMAILEYLEEKHPSASILPKDPIARAQARMIAESINSGIQPLQNLAVLQRVKGELRGDERAWAKHWITRGLTAVEGLVSSCAGTYCVGDTVTLADMCLIPQLHNARRFDVDLTAFPKLMAIEKACEALPAFQHAHPDLQPDAAPA
jgi:maleylpyruvate isomerase